VTWSSIASASGLSEPVTGAEHSLAPRAATVTAARINPEALYRENCDFVWRNARRLGCSDEWVDDAVHETFLIANRRISEFEGKSNLQTWLFAIVLRVVQRMRRDRARYSKRISNYADTRRGDLAPSPEAASDASHYLRQLLAELDEPKRVALILIELEGFTALEVSRALGTPQGTIETRLRAARRELSQLLERDRLLSEGKSP
jgi:RNA polymerase sigma-70 factor (ECF subfamily)